MRKHYVNCQIENEKSAEYLQHKANIYTAIYIKKVLSENKISKEERLAVIDKLIETVREYNKDEKTM